jgi:hypothetical protein
MPALAGSSDGLICGFSSAVRMSNVGCGFFLFFVGRLIFSVSLISVGRFCREKAVDVLGVVIDARFSIGTGFFDAMVPSNVAVFVVAVLRFGVHPCVLCRAIFPCLAQLFRRIGFKARITLADLYDPMTTPSDLVKAHEALDRAVERCYRPEAFDSDCKRVEFLFSLYEKLTVPLLPPSGKNKSREINPTKL